MEKHAIPRGTDSAKVIQVIETISIKGEGTKKDPVRIIYQYWDFNGKLLAIKDNYLEETKSLASSDINS